MNQPTLYVSNSVSDEHIRAGFESVFSEYGNNVVEGIEVRGDIKVVHVSSYIYEKSNADPDDFYNEFDGQESLTFGLFEGIHGEWWTYDANYRAERSNVKHAYHVFRM